MKVMLQQANNYLITDWNLYKSTRVEGKETKVKSEVNCLLSVDLGSSPRHTGHQEERPGDSAGPAEAGANSLH